MNRSDAYANNVHLIVFRFITSIPLKSKCQVTLRHCYQHGHIEKIRKNVCFYYFDTLMTRIIAPQQLNFELCLVCDGIEKYFDLFLTSIF